MGLYPATRNASRREDHVVGRGENKPEVSGSLHCLFPLDFWKVLWQQQRREQGLHATFGAPGLQNTWCVSLAVFVMFAYKHTKQSFLFGRNLCKTDSVHTVFLSFFFPLSVCGKCWIDEQVHVSTGSIQFAACSNTDR